MRYDQIFICIFFSAYVLDHLDLLVRTHSFPTRLSSDLTFFMVLCCMGGAGSGLSPWGAENGERLARATLNLNESGAVRRHEPRGRKDHRAGAGPVGRRGHAPCRSAPGRDTGVSE